MYVNVRVCVYVDVRMRVPVQEPSKGAVVYELEELATSSPAAPDFGFKVRA